MFWTEYVEIKEVVRENWRAAENNDFFTSSKHKMKNIKVALSNWSREKFVDVFNHLKITEDIVRVK